MSTGLGGALVGGCAAAAMAGPVEIDALRWLSPEADRVRALTTMPVECAVAPDDPEATQAVALGRVAFRSPRLLGGLAARMGMSCDACHRNGHGNPDFFVAGVSGRPGSVDVTGRIFGARRDDGVENPVPIPSLLDVGARSPLGSVVPQPDLPRFVHAVVVDEFEGRPPPPSVERGLLAYLHALREEACPSERRQAIDLAGEARALRETLATALRAIDRGDRAGAAFVLRSLRAALGRVHRRFPAEVAERDSLVELSRAFARARPQLAGEGDLSIARALLVEAGERQEVVLDLLAPLESSSYYDARRLRSALASLSGSHAGGDVEP